MRIIRKRRGFTTNSSSAADWVQADWFNPPPPPTNKPLPSTNASTLTTNTAANAPATNAMPLPRTATQPSKPSQIRSGNLETIGGIVAAVIGLFVVERFLRRIFTRKNKS